MDVFTFVIIVVLIGCGSGVINNYMKNQRNRNKVTIDEDAQQELVELRGRIEILEKIVTDEKYQLQRDLDHLERQA
ncbi:MAG: hypothetical protein V3T18_09710 [Pseudomonadales bacterium]